MKRLLSLVYLSSFVFASAAFSTEATISKFAGEQVGAPDDYIAAEFNDELKKANPNAIQDGRFYVRQKFEDPFDPEATNYGVYEGKQTATGKAKLGKFAIVDKPYSDVLRTKFYISATAKLDQDIDRVYFDGKFVFVEGETPIYYSQDGKMIELKPSIERVSYLNITTQPAGAEIFVNSESKGKSPTKISILGAKPVVLSLSKPGYYTKITISKPMPGLTVDVGELLTEKKDLESPAVAMRAKLTDLKTKKDNKGIQTLRNNIQDKITSFPKESGAIVQKQMAAYPPNAAQSKDESADDYASRTTAWQKDRDAEQAHQQSLADKVVDDLKALLAEIDATPVAAAPAPVVEAPAKLELVYVYIPPSAIQLGRFNKAKNQIEISIYLKTDAAAFTYAGAVDVGSLSKEDFTAKKDQLQGVLKLWNISNAAGKTPVSHGLSFFLNQTALTNGDKGNYNSTDANAAINAKGTDLEAKLAKLPATDKSKFDADESSKTKALLQTFSSAAAVPAPVPTVSAPAPEATEAPATTNDVDSSTTAQAEPIQAPVADASAVSSSEARHDNANAAVDDIDAKFGRQDEYRRWAGWGLVASAVVSIGVGAMQQFNYNKAKKTTDKQVEARDALLDQLYNDCPSANQTTCYEAAQFVGNQPGQPLYLYNAVIASDKKTTNSYSTGRNIFFGIAALSIAGSVVLFTW